MTDRDKLAAIFGKNTTEIIVGYARTLSDSELRVELVERMDYALDGRNNSGAFAIVALLIAELESRGLAAPEVVAFRQRIEAAILQAHRRLNKRRQSTV